MGVSLTTDGRVKGRRGVLLMAVDRKIKWSGGFAYGGHKSGVRVGLSLTIGGGVNWSKEWCGRRCLWLGKEWSEGVTHGWSGNIAYGGRVSELGVMLLTGRRVE